jgi:threonine dehydrogenase-like Zn-dependent dehydrogenase
MGHEFMGEVVETGSGVHKEKLKAGDRVVVPCYRWTGELTVMLRAT